MNRLLINKFGKLLASIVVCQLAGVVGSFFTRISVDTWYSTLKKPFFTPPNSWFAPVWIVLYILMGVSSFLVWERGLDDKEIKNALKIFILQLLFNCIWSMAFFGLQSPLAGFVVIIVLWLLILWTIFEFIKISKASAILLVPYVIWVSFAVVLNGSILILNF